MAKKEMKYIREEYVMSEEDNKNYNTVHLPTKNGYGIYKEFLFLNQFALLDIAKNHKLLGKQGMAVFLWLLARVSVGNQVYTTLDEIALDMKIDKGNVCREINKMAKRNIIIKKSRLEGSTKMQMEIAFNFDRLNSNIGYKGKLKTSKVKNQQQEDEPILPLSCVRVVEKGYVSHVHADSGTVVWQTGDKIPNSSKDKNKIKEIEASYQVTLEELIENEK